MPTYLTAAQPAAPPYGCPVMNKGAVTALAVEGLDGNFYDVVRCRGTVAGSTVSFSIEPGKVKAIGHVRPGYRIVTVKGGYVFMPKAGYGELQVLMNNNPTAEHFQVVSLGNGSVTLSIMKLGNQVTAAQMISKVLRKRVVDPDVDCACGGEATGYVKGHPGHAFWCAWRQA